LESRDKAELRTCSKLVATGPSEAIAAEKRSYTGQFLKELLERQPKGKREAAE